MTTDLDRRRMQLDRGYISPTYHRQRADSGGIWLSDPAQRQKISTIQDLIPFWKKVARRSAICVSTEDVDGEALATFVE